MARLLIPALLLLCATAGADPAREGVELLYSKEGALTLLDLGRNEESTLVSSAYGDYERRGRRLLVSDVERLWLVDLDGKRKQLIVRLPKIVHPGCGHVESALQGYRFVQGGTRVRFTYRKVPRGVDPHADDTGQYHDAWVKADGSGLQQLPQRILLHADYHNLGAPDYAPDGSRFVASRRTRALGEDGVAIELYEGGEGARKTIAQLELRVLSNLRGSWSPDGERYLFFHSHRTPGKRRSTVYSFYRWDGKACSKLHDVKHALGLGGTGTYVVVWSPDGRQVAFLPGFSSKTARLRLLDVTSGKTRQHEVSYARRTDLGKPVWLPDSRRVALVARGALLLFDPAADRHRALVPAGVAPVPPTPSPDGQRLYFWQTGDRQAGLRLAAVEIATGKVTIVSQRTKIDPRDSRLLFPGAVRRARKLYQDGKGPEAVALLRFSTDPVLVALRRRIQQVHRLSERARQAAALKKREETINLLRTVQSLVRDRSNRYHQQAEARMPELHRPSMARDGGRQAEAYFSRGMYEEAAAAARRDAAHSPRAREVLRKVIDRTLRRWTLARNLWTNKRYDDARFLREALPLYRALRAGDPQHARLRGMTDDIRAAGGKPPR